MVVLTEKRPDGVALVTLNRPNAMNALSQELRARLAEVMVDIDKDEAVRAVVLTGAGRAFTAGLDLKELGAGASIAGAANSDRPEGNPVLAIERCSKPVIGAINGVAITGGFEVALACDILLGCENTRFADTHARVGILPGWGLSQKLSRLVGISRAKEISLTGNFIDAETALAWGLVNRLYPAAELVPAALKLAADIASVPPANVRDYKRLIDEGFALPYGESVTFELESTRKRNAAVRPADVEAARQQVMARGRAQQGT